MAERRYNIGLLVANLNDPFSNEISKGAMLAAEKLDTNLIIVPGKYIDVDIDGGHTDTTYEYQYNALFSHVASGNLDYLVVCIGTIAYTSTNERKRRLLELLGDTPILCVCSHIDGYDYIQYNNTNGIIEAVDYLVNQSKRQNIAMLSGNPYNIECAERLAAYKTAIEKNGLVFRESLVSECDLSDQCQDAVNKLLDANPDIDAILCVNDAIASAVYSVLHERNISIGRDIAVIGFDDLPFAAKMEPPLASVRADAATLGYHAMERAVNTLNGKIDDKHEIETAFIPRQSCGTLISAPEEIFTGNESQIITGILNYVFNKPAQNAVYERFSHFIFGAVANMKSRFIDRAASEDDMYYIISQIDKFFITDQNMMDPILRIFTIIDNIYDWLYSKTPEYNRGYVRKIYEFFYRRITNYALYRCQAIEDKHTEKNHLANIAIRDTLMFDSNTKYSYAAILRKMHYMDVDTSYLYIFNEPVLYKKGDIFPRDSDWYFKSYQYGSDIFTVPENEQHITSKELFNNKYLPEGRRYTLIMTDIYSTEYQYGIALCEPRSTDFFSNYELLTYQLSAAVKMIALLTRQEKMLTELHSHNLALENMTKLDELTGIYNRRGFYFVANKLVNHPDNKDKQLTIAYADMDNLKMVNDRYGHIEGDFSIRALANCLTELFAGESSIVGRVGGDEYAVIAMTDEVGSKDELTKRKEELIANLNKNAEKPYKINMSVGIYECKCENIYDIKDALDKADDLLYAVKRNRKKEI